VPVAPKTGLYYAVGPRFVTSGLRAFGVGAPVRQGRVDLWEKRATTGGPQLASSVQNFFSWTNQAVLALQTLLASRQGL
jgi:hypothetical protein